MGNHITALRGRRRLTAPAASALAALALMALAVHVARGQGPREESQVVSGFRVPGFNREGFMTSQLFGDTARLLPNGVVEIAELRLEFYAPDPAQPGGRRVEMRITSPRCIYDRATGTATSDAPVRIARDNMVVTGRGFRWSTADERLEIFSESKVVIRDLRRGFKTESTHDEDR